MFNATKGFGFIQPDSGGKDVFVHISAVERAGVNSLNEDRRSAHVQEERGKLAAVNLKAWTTEVAAAERPSRPTFEQSSLRLIFMMVNHRGPAPLGPIVQELIAMGFAAVKIADIPTGHVRNVLAEVDAGIFAGYAVGQRYPANARSDLLLYGLPTEYLQEPVCPQKDTGRFRLSSRKHPGQCRA